MARRSLGVRNEVPYLHESTIEQEVDCLLQEYALKFHNVAAPPVPVDEIAELHLQLILEFKDMKSLFPFADVHGAIWFEERKIGIDTSLDPATTPSRRGRYHFTLAHEVGHWRLHRQHFITNPAERRLFDDGSRKPDVVCRSSERKRPVEWQADAFAALLMMPRKMVFAAWSHFRGGDDRPMEVAELNTQSSETRFYHGRLATTEEERRYALVEHFCRPLAEQFQVSAEAMRIRLENLELVVSKRPATLF